MLRILVIVLIIQCSFLFIIFTAVASKQLLVQPQVLQMCTETPPDLVGFINVSYWLPSYDELERLNDDLEVGGIWRPRTCIPRDRVAVVVPYRDRDTHLRTFLHHIHPFLQKQQLHYGIYVVEQSSSSTFNRGMLMNIGFVEALKLRDWDCFIFHDVDLLPENDHNLYACPSSPRHMSVAVDSMAYRLMYDTLFGGIEAFSRQHFQLINGFSNQFFGWGGEDDNLYDRINDAGLNLTRYSASVARYHMLYHPRGRENPRREHLLSSAKQFETDALDGLNSLGGYKVKVEHQKLFTRFFVDINQKYVMAAAAETAARYSGRARNRTSVSLKNLA